MGNEADVTDTKGQFYEGLMKICQQKMTVLRLAELDNTDNEGDLLNEGSLATSVSGADLDMSVLIRMIRWKQSAKKTKKTMPIVWEVIAMIMLPKELLILLLFKRKKPGSCPAFFAYKK
jgi:hypothetical protein